MKSLWLIAILKKELIDSPNSIIFYSILFYHLWASWYGSVVVHPQPAAHSVPEDGDRVPLTNHNSAVTDDLRRSRPAVKPEGQECTDQWDGKGE